MKINLERMIEMGKFINFIKMDFVRCRFAVDELFGGKVPMWAFLLYYVIVGAICLPMYPLVKLWASWQIRQMMKIKEEGE